MEYTAHYRRKNLNPFVPNYQALEGATLSKTANLPDDIPLEQVKQMAKEATPKGYEFVEVKPVKKGGN